MWRDDSGLDVTILEAEAEFKPSGDLALMLVGLRLHLGMSQAEFARGAGVSQAYISQLESGIANPSIRKLGKLLRKHGLELSLGVVPVTNGAVTTGS